MKLPQNVKPKSVWWDMIPWISNRTAQAVYPNVYLPQSVYKDLISKKPGVWNRALLIHEQEHIKRQKEFGPFRWFIRYVLVPRFRFEEEVAADVPKFRFLKQNGGDPMIEKRARRLSSWLYFWPVSYEVAKKLLERTWARV